jgi:hypothetical protein
MARAEKFWKYTQRHSDKTAKTGFVGFDSTDLGGYQEFLGRDGCRVYWLFWLPEAMRRSKSLGRAHGFLGVFTIYSILVVTWYPLATTEISGEMRSIIGQWRWLDDGQSFFIG